MIVLGIDPGITHCAVAATSWRDRKPIVEHVAYWHTPPDSRITKTADCRDRICRLMIEVHKVASKMAPHVIAVEGFQSFGQVNSWETTQVLRLLGRLEGYAIAIEVPYVEIYTQQVKAAIGAGRTATKREVQRCVEARTGYALPVERDSKDKERETIADAIAVGIAQRILGRRDLVTVRKAAR